MKTEFIVQHQGLEVNAKTFTYTLKEAKINEKEVLNAVKEKLKEENIKIKDIQSLSIYIVPEQNKAYYVVNNNPKGFVNI